MIPAAPSPAKPISRSAPVPLRPMPLVLFGIGLLGYALALWTFRRRDLPAPL